MRKRLAAHAPGLTPRAVLETLADILMLDVHLPLADGRELVLPRDTQPEPEQRLVLEKLGWELPAQPPPRLGQPQVADSAKQNETKSKMEWRPLGSFSCKPTPYVPASRPAMNFQANRVKSTATFRRTITLLMRSLARFEILSMINSGCFQRVPQPDDRIPHNPGEPIRRSRRKPIACVAGTTRR